MIIKKKNVNKKVTPNEPKHAEAEKKQNTDLTKKVVQISEKKYIECILQVAMVT